MTAGVRAFALTYGTWLILAPTRWDFLLLGLLAAALASLWAKRHAAAQGPDEPEAVLARPLAAAAYMPGALWRALLGGVDVTSRVLRPRLPIKPLFVRYGSGEATSHPMAGAVFSGIISLMPGTLAAGRDRDGHLWVHLLTADDQTHAVLDAEHQRIDHVIIPRHIQTRASQ